MANEEERGISGGRRDCGDRDLLKKAELPAVGLLLESVDVLLQLLDLLLDLKSPYDC